MRAWSASAATTTACPTPPAGGSEVQALADEIQIFEAGQLVARHPVLEGRN
jgi:hypothetical protein